MTTRSAALLAAAVITVASAGACTTDVDTARRCTGRIAFLGALSGGNASFVIPALYGARLAFAEFADTNPSCKIVLTPFDTEGDPAKAAPAATKIAADETFLGVIGGAFSGETRQTKKTFDDGGVTMISPSATATDLSIDDPAAVFHRVVGHDQVQGAAIGKYFTEVLDAKRIFVIDDGSAYGSPLAKKVVDTVGSAVIAGRDHVQERQMDFTATVTKVENAGADAVFYAGYAAEAGPLVKQLRNSGVDVPFVGGDGLYGSDLLKAAGSQADGAIVTCPCLPPNEISAAFAREYERRYGEPPGSYAGEGYDAATIFVSAIAAGNRTRASVEGYVDRYDRPGVTKHIKFDGNGDIDLSKVTIWAYIVRGGKLVPDREITLNE